MPAIFCAAKILFGVREPLPPMGFPPGRLRFRIRCDAFVLARVRTPDGIREFHVREEDGRWLPSHERGRNHTA